MKETNIYIYICILVKIGPNLIRTSGLVDYTKVSLWFKFWKVK